MVLTGYPTLILLLLLCTALPFLLMFISQVVQVKYPTALKYTTYESGMTPFGDSHIQFDIKFYLYALLFILFDIETIFFFPWAMAFDDLVASMGILPLIEMLLFVLILVVGLVYAWRRDALRWQ